MPCDYSLYPKDWNAIRAEVLERAGNRCEQCKVLNKDHVWRGAIEGHAVYQVVTMEVYSAETGEKLSDHGLDLGIMEGANDNKLTPIVLTISHTDHDVTNNGEPGNRPNLKALCQRCHNRHDQKYRQANAAKTRKRKMGTADMFTDQIPDAH